MASSSAVRDCLVCGTPTASTHYGVDACRACTVFYRRALQRPMYACRQSTRRCGVAQDGIFACKRCRFDRFEKILRESGIGDVHLQTESDAIQLPHISEVQDLEQAVTQPTPRPLLDKSANAYKSLCAMRRNSELNARANPPHPSKIYAGEYDVPASTYQSLNGACRYLVTGILDFAEMMYPEFATFSRDEQWRLAVSFYNRIFMFDAAYRADKAYPDDMSKCLGAYTSYMSVDVVEHFFDDCPNQSANVEEAKRVLRKCIGMGLPSTRIALRNAHLDEVEFLTVLILTFWFADCLQLREEIGHIGHRYRQQALKELQAYYREDLRLEDYTGRIGELFTIIFNFDRNSDVQEELEIYRLLGVFVDETFVYRLDTRS